MQDKIEKSIKVLNNQIASSSINEESKKHLYEVIKGILTSLNNRVYSVKEEDHTSYITLKPNSQNQNSLLEICIVDKTISSSESTSKLTFPSIIELSNYIETNLEEISNSLSNIAYFSTLKKDLDEEKLIEKAFANKQPKITDTIKEITDNTNISDDVKECINKVLSNLNENQTKLLTFKDESFEEYLTIQENSIMIIRKIYNLTNQVVGESSYVILPDEFPSYIEEHLITIEETLNQNKHL